MNPTLQNAVLEILRANGGEMYGLDIVKASNGRVTRGGVYVTLDTLEEKGLVTSKADEQKTHGIARRRYSAVQNPTS